MEGEGTLLSIEHWYKHATNCTYILQGEGTLLSIEHWYKPGTNCTYLLQGSATQGKRSCFHIIMESKICYSIFTCQF